MRNWIAVLLAWLCLATSAFAENRLALVIGNDRYDHLSETQQLSNAVNDARAVKKVLEGLNFQVDLGENLDRTQFIDKLSEFSARLQSGDIAFFFFAGHGVSFSGANYMLPRDIPAPRTYGPTEERRLAALAVSESDVVEDIRAAEARVTVMVLDACRDNPLVPPRGQGRSLGGERGLQPPPQSSGVLTIYSAGAGQKAADLGDGNSIFTGILVRELATPGLGLRELAFNTQGEVAALAKANGLLQQPGVYSQIIGDDIYLAGPPKSAVPSDETLKKMIDNAKSADFLATLIAGLPDGPLKDRAKARSEALKQVANLALEPPKPAPTTASANGPEGAGVVPLLGHADAVVAVAFSPDGRFIVSGSFDHTLKLWDAANGALLKTLKGHGKQVNSVAFSPNGRFIVSGSFDHTLKLWDAASGALLKTFEGHDDSVNSVVFSPDGRFIVSGSGGNTSGDNTLKLWDAASGELLKTLKGHDGYVDTVAFSPDGRFIVSGGWDHTLKLWDAANGVLLKTFKGHDTTVLSLAFSPDGRFIVSGSWDNTLKLWDAANGALLKTLKGSDSYSWVFSVAFSPDGRFIVSGSGDKTLKLWDAANGVLLKTFKGHDGSVRSVAFSPDGRFIVSGSDDHTLKLWDAASAADLTSQQPQRLQAAASPQQIAPEAQPGKPASVSTLYRLPPGAALVPQSVHGGFIEHLAYAPDDRTFVSVGSYDGALKLWDVNSGRLLRTFDGHVGAARQAAFSPDGRMIASVGDDWSVKLWDVSDGRLVKTFSATEATSMSVAFSPDGRTLASGGSDGHIELWDVGSGERIGALAEHKSYVDGVAFSPDGRTLLSASWDKSVKLWDVAAARLLWSFEIGEYLNCGAFSPDGRTVLIGGDKTLTLLDVADGHVVRRFDQAPTSYGVVFMRDGKTAISAGPDDKLTFWDVDTGKLTKAVDAHHNGVRSLALSRDGRFLLSGGDDDTESIIDLQSGLVAKTFGGAKRHSLVTAAIFFPDGQKLIAGMTDGTMRVWDINSRRPIQTLDGHHGFVDALALSPDHRTLISAGGEQFKIWDLASGALIRSIRDEHVIREEVSIAVSPDGKTMIAANDVGYPTLFDLASGLPVRTFKGHKYLVLSVAFAPDGLSFVSASWDNTLKLWDVASGKEIRTFEGHSGPVSSVAFSPDGRTIISGSMDQTIRLWDVGSGDLRRTFSGHLGAVSAVAFSPDGRVVLSGSWDRTMKLWDADTGRLLQTFEGSAAAVTAVAIAPDARTVMGACRDEGVRLWDMASGKLQATLYSVGRDWLSIDSDGRYKASDDPRKFVSLVQGAEFLPMDKFVELNLSPLSPASGSPAK